MGLLDSLDALLGRPEVSQGLLNMGANMMVAGGPSQQPTNFLSTLGHGMNGFSQGVQQSHEMRQKETEALYKQARLSMEMQKMQEEIQQRAALSGIDLSNPDAVNQLAKIGKLDEAISLKKSKDKTFDPYYQVMETSNGLYRFNARTGDYEPLTEGDKPLMRSTSDPLLQGNIQKAKDLNKIEKQTLSDGRQVPMFNGQAPTVDSSNIMNQLMPALAQVESGNNPNAVSSKGATGTYQIMPDTAKNPGLGVTPLQNNSEEEQKRFATEYLSALINHYKGDTNKALQAYNMGFGNVDNGHGNPAYAEKVLNNVGIGQTTADKEKTQQSALTTGTIERENAKAAIENQQKLDQANQKKENGASNMLSLLKSDVSGKPIESLIDEATGSGAGVARDAALGFFGKSSNAGNAAEQLKTLQGWLVSNVPRMEGPQSDFDVKNYQQMAAALGDPFLPSERKKAALQGLIGILEKYSGNTTNASSAEQRRLEMRKLYGVGQ